MSGLTEERLNELEAWFATRKYGRLRVEEVLPLVAAARANAKLVEALVEARAALRVDETVSHTALLDQCDAALAAAGVKP